MNKPTNQTHYDIPQDAGRLINITQDYWLIKDSYVNSRPNADLLEFFRKSLAKVLSSMTDEGWERVRSGEWWGRISEFMDDFQMPVPDKTVEKGQNRREDRKPYIRPRQPIQGGESDGTADRRYDDAPQEAKRLFDLIMAKGHLLNRNRRNKPLDNHILRLLDMDIEATVGSLGDEDWDYVISTEGNGRFRKILKGWRKRRQPSAKTAENKTAEKTRDAERFLDLAQMFKFLVKGRPCPRTIGNFDREYAKVIDSMTDEGWDYVLNNGPLQEIAKEWRKNGKPSVSATTDCDDCTRKR